MNAFTQNAFGGAGGGGANLSTMSAGFMRLATSPGFWQVGWPADTSNAGTLGAYISAVTGTGQTQTNDFSVLAQTGATADSRASAKILGGGFEGMGLAPRNTADWRQLDWSSPVFIGFSFSVFAATAAGKIWFKIGNTSATSGDLAGAGLQFRVDNLDLSFGAHDGALLNEAAPSTLTAANRQHDVRIEGDGAGNFAFYLNNTLIDTLSGPTAAVGTDARITVEAWNDTDSANAGIWCSAIKIGVLQ